MKEGYRTNLYDEKYKKSMVKKVLIDGIRKCELIKAYSFSRQKLDTWIKQYKNDVLEGQN
jgi:transposase-like protein